MKEPRGRGTEPEATGSGEPGRADPDAIYVGLDLGTSGLKAIALRASGDVVARASIGYPTGRPCTGAAEQDPGDWLMAIERGAATLAANAPPAQWRAIGLSAMIPTLVTVGAAGDPVGHAITWEDGRAQAQADRLRAEFRGELYEITGQRIDGRYLLPMFLRLVEDDPARADQTTIVLEAKDYLFGWLTGAVATDPSTATGFGCLTLQTGEWNRGILAAAAAATASQAGQARGNDAFPVLPPVLPATTTRPLRRGLAARFGCDRIPVCLGAADSVLGALGLGARSAGQIAYVAGTSTVILGVAGQPLLDPQRRFLVTPLAEPGVWGLEMDLLATGSALRWLAEMLGGGLDEAGVIALAARVDPADAPVVLPYLSPGEQGALWDPELPGTITGLTLAHDRRHLARGLVNGIIMESRRCLAVLDQTAAFGTNLLVAGGGAEAASFRADLANATGRRVIMPAGDEADFSARGAAMLAAQSVGQLPELVGADAAGDPIRSQVSEPDASQADMWSELWSAHERASFMLRSANKDRQRLARRDHLPGRDVTQAIRRTSQGAW
jgi:xylulokinase